MPKVKSGVSHIFHHCRECKALIKITGDPQAKGKVKLDMECSSCKKKNKGSIERWV